MTFSKAVSYVYTSTHYNGDHAHRTQAVGSVRTSIWTRITSRSRTLTVRYLAFTADCPTTPPTYQLPWDALSPSGFDRTAAPPNRTRIPAPLPATAGALLFCFARYLRAPRLHTITPYHYAHYRGTRRTTCAPPHLPPLPPPPLWRRSPYTCACGQGPWERAAFGLNR